MRTSLSAAMLRLFIDQLLETWYKVEPVSGLTSILQPSYTFRFICRQPHILILYYKASVISHLIEVRVNVFTGETE